MQPPISAIYTSCPQRLPLQHPHNIETLIRQAKPLLALLRQATCAHTAYISFVRLFFVRACEDHGIRPYLPSHHHSISYAPYRPTSLPELQDSYRFLIQMIYPHACSSQYYFGDFHESRDFSPAAGHTLIALSDLLNTYDLRGLHADILGRIYNEGYIEKKERSARGQFYTPSHIVEYMLDTIGIPQADDGAIQADVFLEKTVGDLSCGSGSFLVAAAARKRVLLQRLLASGTIDADRALHILASTMLGFDLDPLACYLAEINLLMQCLPFLSDQNGQLCRSVARFHIYCTDALEPTSLSLAQTGVDYLVGNPPYVSASEGSENQAYRDKISHSGIYRLLHQRWDLFIPFFERNLQFLRPRTGKLALLVSNGIETEGYAHLLRRALSTQYSLLQIDFFPCLRLFPDAAIENTMVFLANQAPDAQHLVARRKHLQADCHHFETLPSAPQLASAYQLFRWRYDHELHKNVTANTMPFCAIVYIGTGIEAQSAEVSDPVIAGKRQKRFTLDDVFLAPSQEKSDCADYTDRGVLGDDIAHYHLRRQRLVAYEHYRPYMRGPRHPALFRTPEKLLLGETSGGYYDRCGLFANHSVQVAVPWRALAGAHALTEKGIQRVLRRSQQLSGLTDLASVSERFDLRYLLAIINSQFMRRYIFSNLHEGTRRNRIYPDIWKRLPIKLAPLARQAEIAALVDKVQSAYMESSAPSPQLLPTIEALLSEIEALVEITYAEPTQS